jgi:hypothetical protein
VKARANRLTDAELDEAMAYAHGSLRLTAALAELKERRALDMTDRDCELLRIVRDDVLEFGLADDDARGLWREAAGVLSKLVEES